MKGRFTAALLYIVLPACAGPEGARGWGADATWRPGGSAAGAAARDAILDPRAWVPAALAVGLASTGMDDDLAEYARDEQPLFGSTERADERTDDLRNGLLVGALLTSLAAPSAPGSGAGPGAWFAAKGRGLTVAGGTALAGDAVTDLAKDAAGRERPDGTDDDSFPSGHAVGASAALAWIEADLELTSLSAPARSALRWTARGATFATAWGRVEAGRHHPSDVLAGVAFGHALTRFARTAFLRADGGAFEPDVHVDGDAVLLGLRWRF